MALQSFCSTQHQNMAKQVQLINLFFLLAFLYVLSTSTKVVEARKCKSHTTCSPPVTKRTKAILTINDFQKGGDGGGPSECDNKYHSNKKPVVALSTGWFNNMKRCHKYITIYANGRSVKAMVVDECDSTRGCKNNIVDASKAVWKALHVPKKDWGWMEVHWSDA